MACVHKSNDAHLRHGYYQNLMIFQKLPYISDRHLKIACVFSVVPILHIHVLKTLIAVFHPLFDLRVCKVILLPATDNSSWV